MKGARWLASVVLALSCHGGEATAPQPPPAPRLVIMAGDQQQANVCAALPVAPAVRADSAGTALRGVRVSFTVTAGGGTVTGDTAVTDAAGLATVGSWTLGTGAGTNTLMARSPAVATAVSFTATGHPETVLHNVIIYTSESTGLPAVEIVRPDGSCRRRITTDGLSYNSPAISADGRRIAVGRYRDGIWLLNVDGTGWNRLLDVPRSAFDGAPAWSPDGSTIAFESQDSTPIGPIDRIFLVNVDGTGLRRLTFDTYPTFSFDAGPAWSPDGRRIVFSRTGVLYVINADGTGLTNLQSGGEYPSWSPDGAHIVSSAYSTGWWLLTMVNADGTNPVTVIRDTLQLGMPRWSPDGGSLVFNGIEGTMPNLISQLFTIHIDGSGRTKLSAAAVNEGWPNWGRMP